MAGAWLLKAVLWCAAGLGITASALAQDMATQEIVVLERKAREVELQTALGWLDTQGRADLNGALQAQPRYRTVDLSAVQPLTPSSALWLRFTLQGDGTPSNWVLELPIPLLDQATLYQRSGSAPWQASRAGDRVPMSQWPEPGRHPAFQVQVPASGTTELLLQIRHNTALSLLMRLTTAANHTQRIRFEYLGLGILFGGVMLVAATSLRRAWVLKDRAHAWYSAYALLAMLAMAAYTGLANHLLWGEWVGWADAAPGLLALAAATVITGIVGELAALSARHPILYRWTQGLFWSGPVIALVYLGVERHHGVALAGAFMSSIAFLVLTIGAITWRRGDPVGRWMLTGAAPLALTVLLALARLLGLVESHWLMEYALVGALAWDLPMLQAALNSRSRERRSTQLRKLASVSHDPLTGLLKSGPFHRRLDTTLARCQRTGEACSLVLVEIVNLEAIKAARGAEVAEECLLRAVLKIQKLARDADTIGRLGDACFGVLLEGADSRSDVSNFASHLVASGLMEEAESPGDPTLRFHIATALLHERLPGGPHLVERLQDLLSGMAAHTRRPIRHLEPAGA